MRYFVVHYIVFYLKNTKRYCIGWY